MTGQTPNPESTNLVFFPQNLLLENQKTDCRKNKKSGIVVSGLGV